MIASGALDHLPSIAPNELTTDYYNKLIQAIGLRRDREAFTTLFNSLAPKVQGYIIRRGVAADLAENLAIETFVKIWGQARAFDPMQGSAPAWIFTIARNTIIDAVRRERHVSELAHLVDDAPGSATSEDECLGAEREQRVQSALRQLPEKLA